MLAVLNLLIDNNFPELDVDYMNLDNSDITPISTAAV